MPDHPAVTPTGYALIPARTTYLEMLRNEVPEPTSLPEGVSAGVWEHPQVQEYRRLFRAVGGPWGWAERMLLSDGELSDLLEGGTDEVVRLIVRGQEAGLCELDRSVPGEVELVYFGLTPEFIGRGLGGIFLRWSVNYAWTNPGPTASGRPMRRLWLHTCQHDSPAALPLYERTGFRVYGVKDQLELYPEDFVRRSGLD